MSRKDGVLALLVVVVWGLNFVVIKVGLHNMPPLMLAGLPLYAGRFSGHLFCCTTESTTEFALGVWINHQFCAVCLSVLRH
ncbi:O-acetylserine/cysteine export protein [Escherichia coli]|uniref:O-acetylserine/cysteine export protein n=1 Tax=Escherichia coli TaxID=562 RepID=A0A377BBS1_ECOLX|nr:O-acetylserine/cysteine export protein [Escherichia coli]